MAQTEASFTTISIQGPSVLNVQSTGAIEQRTSGNIQFEGDVTTSLSKIQQILEYLKVLYR